MIKKAFYAFFIIIVVLLFVKIKDVYFYVFSIIRVLHIEGYSRSDDYTLKKVQLNNILRDNTTKELILIGDSHIAKFPKHLTNESTALNLGVSGETSELLLKRIFNYKELDYIDIAVVLVGSNDAALLIERDKFAKNYQHTLDILAQRGLDVIVTTIPPTCGIKRKPQLIIDYNELIKDIAIRNRLKMIDLYSLVKNREEEFLKDDCIHLNEEAYSIFFDRVKITTKQ